MEKDEIKKNPTLSPAHVQANTDIKKDPHLAVKPAPEDGLDEGELAKLEGED